MLLFDKLGSIWVRLPIVRVVLCFSRKLPLRFYLPLFSPSRSVYFHIYQIRSLSRIFWVIWWFREHHHHPAKSSNHPLSLFVILVRKHIILRPILAASFLFFILNLFSAANIRIPNLILKQTFSFSISNSSLLPRPYLPYRYYSPSAFLCPNHPLLSIHPSTVSLLFFYSLY